MAPDSDTETNCSQN